jgi:hypothetical protein
MPSQETLITKKRRGPKPTGQGLLIGVRLQPNELESLDLWAASQPDAPSRPEAIRRILRTTLGDARQAP